MDAKMHIEAGQLRRWREGAERSGTFMVIEEEVNKFGSGPGDAWNTVLLLMDGTLKTLSNFTIFHQSEVIDGTGNAVAGEGAEAD